MMISSMLPSLSIVEPTKFGRGTVSVLRHGKVLITAVDRPEVRNAFNDDVYSDLTDVMHQVAADSSLAALVLTGRGSFFSSGADLKSTPMDPKKHSISILERPAGRFVMSLLAFPKIVVAAVNGPAVGIACTILLHCDLVYCSDRATLWAPFTRLALVPEACSSVTFQEVMGLSKANEMLLLGKKIDAKTAMDWNICSQVVPSRGNTGSGDPFSKDSLATYMCQELDKRLLSLPLGDATAQVFVSLVRGPRRARLQQVCRDEFLRLDQRFQSGEVSQAAQKVLFGKKKNNSNTQRSKL